MPDAFINAFFGLQFAENSRKYIDPADFKLKGKDFKRKEWNLKLQGLFARVTPACSDMNIF